MLSDLTEVDCSGLGFPPKVLLFLNTKHSCNTSIFDNGRIKQTGFKKIRLFTFLLAEKNYEQEHLKEEVPHSYPVSYMLTLEE